MPCTRDIKFAMIDDYQYSFTELHVYDCFQALDMKPEQMALRDANFYSVYDIEVKLQKEVSDFSSRPYSSYQSVLLIVCF